MMLIICSCVLVLLVMVASVRPVRTRSSLFELERRERAGDVQAKATRRREQLLPDVGSLLRVVVSLLLVVFVGLSIATFGWLLGVVVAVVVALEYGALARIPIVERQAGQLYIKYESHLLDFVERFAGLIRFVRANTMEALQDQQLDSREELEHLVAHSESILSSDERKLIVHSLQFPGRNVSEIMTPRGVIDSIGRQELLGPLVLDDLHKTGHSRFPVIDGDIDHVVGVLQVQNLLTLDAKKSITAEQAMEARVFYIREDQTLQHALAAFLRTHHHLFVVVNEFRETVGLLSLEDVIEALLGRKILDEFDAHDDLRAVARRNPRGNNRPDKREDV